VRTRCELSVAFPVRIMAALGTSGAGLAGTLSTTGDDAALLALMDAADSALALHATLGQLLGAGRADIAFSRIQAPAVVGASFAYVPKHDFAARLRLRPRGGGAWECVQAAAGGAHAGRDMSTATADGAVNQQCLDGTDTLAADDAVGLKADGAAPAVGTLSADGLRRRGGGGGGGATAAATSSGRTDADLPRLTKGRTGTDGNTAAAAAAPPPGGGANADRRGGATSWADADPLAWFGQNASHRVRSAQALFADAAKTATTLAAARSALAAATHALS
jgi:hypothetical protein